MRFLVRNYLASINGKSKRNFPKRKSRSHRQNDFYGFLCEYLEINGHVADFAAEIPNAIIALENAFEMYLSE